MTELNAYPILKKVLQQYLQPTNHSLFEADDSAKKASPEEEFVFLNEMGCTPAAFLRYISPPYLQQNLCEPLPTARFTCKFVAAEAHLPHFAVVYYGIFPTWLGDCLVAMVEEGICGIEWIDGNWEMALQRIKKHYKQAIFKRSDERVRPLAANLFTRNPTFSYLLWTNATAFQVKIWELLVQIPTGKCTNYEALAQVIDNPDAAQAVGNAVGANPFAWLVPCHRVINKNGKLGEFRWGEWRKKLLLGRELYEGNE